MNNAFYILSNVQFDNSYKNAVLFSDSKSRETVLHPSNFEEVKKCINFNFGNNIFTSIVVNEYNNQNYCIIQYNNKFYYYFVTSATYLSANQWRLELENDLITQYVTLANSYNMFSNCIIKRAHCNRWKRDGNKVTFDVSKNSQIVKTETNVDKINKTTNKVEFNFFNNQEINNWINENILAWLYIFLDRKHEYEKIGYSRSGTIVPQNYKGNFLTFDNTVNEAMIENDFSCICYPLYKKSNKIIIKDIIENAQCVIDNDNLYEFYKMNSGTQYVYNIKMSKTPPCDFGTNSPDIGIGYDKGNLIIYARQHQVNGVFQGWKTGVIDVERFGGGFEFVGDTISSGGAFVNVWQQFDTVTSNPIETGKRFTFNVSELKGKRNIDFEPKVLLDCYKIKLRDSSNGEYSYNLLHAGQHAVTALYTESLNITNNNYYYRLESTGIIPPASTKNWTGVVNTVDYSQTVANNNIDSFLANNKNFLLYNGINVGIPLVASLATGNVAGAVSGINSMINTYLDYDNISNKANSLRNANDSVFLNMIVNEGLHFYIDIDEALETDKQNYYNYLYNYGYSVNIIDNPFKYFNNRKYFNYVQFDAEYINLNVPLNVESKIKSIFSNGVRLWHVYNKIYDYSNENYEIYLEN